MAVNSIQLGQVWRSDADGQDYLVRGRSDATWDHWWRMRLAVMGGVLWWSDTVIGSDDASRARLGRSLLRALGIFLAVFIARLLPVIRTFIALPAGVARMPRGRFHLYTFLGSWPWCLGAGL